MGTSKIVTLSLDEKLYEKLKQYALAKYGNRKGALKKALEELLKSSLNRDIDLVKRLEKGHPLGKIVERDELHRY